MRHPCSYLALAFLVACGSNGSDGDDNAAGVDAGPAGQDPAPQPLPFAQCAGESDQSGLGEPVCFDPQGSDPVAPPIAAIEHEFVSYEGADAVHIRVTFDPRFVDNTYGANAIGWNRHTFKDLVGSDHAEVLLLDTAGAVVIDAKIDYLSQDASAPCGYSSLGVTGGEGRMLVGDAGAVLGWMTSLDRNLNERGYCAYTVDSPATDESCTPNMAAPDWDFRVVYELWVALAPFTAGFGSAHLNFVHASPAKGGTNTVDIDPADCPDDFCNDPDGCDNGPGDTCSDANPCSTHEFCYEGRCLPIIE